VPLERLVLGRRLQKFDAHVMISLPNHPALPTRLGSSCHIQCELLREVMDVANHQARTCLTQVNESASFENAARRSLNPNGLIERSSKEPTPIGKMRVHSVLCQCCRRRVIAAS
jgi:hypothetical protein